ncbi:MAG: hypothetical protein ACXWV7_06140, partial [Nitrospira sp.]
MILLRRPITLVLGHSAWSEPLRLHEFHFSATFMICLTGNVHHRSYRGVDTSHAQQTEAQLALRYCDIAARHHVKLTLFVTGKTCLEEP